jgi:hypothetical protein
MKLKKILCIVIALAMILSLTACSSSMSGTRIYEAYGFLKTDTYTYKLELPIDGTDWVIEMHRQGDRFYGNLLNGGVDVLMLMNEGKRYDFDREKKIAIESDITRAQFDGMLKSFDDADQAILVLDGARLLSTGRATFQGRELDYEEVREKDGAVVRAFFDGKALVGMVKMKLDGDWLEIPLRISSEVDEEFFKIPADYTIQRS